MNNLKRIRNKRDMTLEEASERLGFSYSTLSRLEAGKTQLTEGRLRRLAQFYKVSIAEILGNGEKIDVNHIKQPGNAVNLTKPLPLPDIALWPKTLPLRGIASASKPGALTLSDNPIDFVRRPPSLANNEEAYAVYVIGDSMEPAISHGELVLVDTIRPSRPGDNVVIQTLDEKTGESLAWVKRLVKIGSVKVIAEQHNPSKKFEFPAKTVKAVHRILTVEDLISI